AELARVLAYDLHKRKLDAAAQAACIAQCRRLSHRIDATLPEPQRSGLPRCRDPEDQKFLEAALVARADFLITRDRALLHLARRPARALPFRTRTPQAVARGPNAIVP